MEIWNSLNGLPTPALALVIFLLRILDVSMGTLRTVSVVHGRVRLAVVLGFVEVLIWVAAVSQVIIKVREQPMLMVAFAAGFAAGNAIGITLERRLAIGHCIVRLISLEKGRDVAERLRPLVQNLTLFRGEGGEGGEKMLVYATCERRSVPRLVDAARAVDPHVFYAVERFSETSPLTPVVNATGWRSVLKSK